ncbi:facilitated trehalose transporter Tret1-like isoform X2 [Rhodnius prolixus]|uniref:facilitated trehalose transporter Tret1-like isoform X2 n=1 Tax=Rhodnius prolixus TaxID=13249 RepID=UPI003D187CAB
MSVHNIFLKKEDDQPNQDDSSNQEEQKKNDFQPKQDESSDHQGHNLSTSNGENPESTTESRESTPGTIALGDLKEKAQNGDAAKHDEVLAEPASAWRRALPQVLASTIKNLLLLDLGMTLGYATIVIPALLEGKDEKGLVFTKEQASWFGSIIFACQPIGSIASGMVLEPLGRKYAMMCVNIPHIIGWFIFYTASSTTAIFAAAIILGMGIGFMEAPIITYVGEICEPRLRGTLTSYSSLFASFGLVFIFGLGNLVDWRTAAGISIALPILTIIALSQVPETPMWLLGHYRERDAEKSLMWLRGWVTAAAVSKELAELKAYAEEARRKQKKDVAAYDNPACEDVENPKEIVAESREKSSETKDNPEPEFDGVLDRIKDFFRPAMLRPLMLIVGFFFFSNFTGVLATRPYMVMVIEKLKMPINPYRATVVFGSIGFIGTVLCMATIALFRKRPIALTSLLVCSLCAFSLAVTPRGFLNGWLSFLFYSLLTFFTLFGAVGLVWTLVSEVFPFRGRSQASGLVAAVSYIFNFISTKTFISLEQWLGLESLFGVYGTISLFGCAFLYWRLPETEGISLRDIERTYMKKKLKTKSEKAEEPQIVLESR